MPNSRQALSMASANSSPCSKTSRHGNAHGQGRRLEVVQVDRHAVGRRRSIAAWNVLDGITRAPLRWWLVCGIGI